MKTKNVAVFTMAYGNALLERWIEYYTSHFGGENVYVVSHGNSDDHKRMTKKCQHFFVPRAIEDNLERRRAQFTSSVAAMLGHAYETVIFVDQDEFIVVDPKQNTPLADYIRDLPDGVHAPLGFTPFPGADSLAGDAPLLSNTSCVEFTATFSKPCIRKNSMARHAPGAHGVFGAEISVSSSLYLFHMKFMDPSVRTEAAARAEEFRSAGLSEEKNIRHWIEGSSWIDQRELKAKGRRLIETDDLHSAVKNAYKIEQSGTEKNAMFAIRASGQAPLFLLPERFKDAV